MASSFCSAGNKLHIIFIKINEEKFHVFPIIFSLFLKSVDKGHVSVGELGITGIKIGELGMIGVSLGELGIVWVSLCELGITWVSGLWIRDKWSPCGNKGIKSIWVI